MKPEETSEDARSIPSNLSTSAHPAHAKENFRIWDSLEAKQNSVQMPHEGSDCTAVVCDESAVEGLGPAKKKGSRKVKNKADLPRLDNVHSAPANNETSHESRVEGSFSTITTEASAYTKSENRNTSFSRDISRKPSIISAISDKTSSAAGAVKHVANDSEVHKSSKEEIATHDSMPPKASVPGGKPNKKPYQHSKKGSSATTASNISVQKADSKNLKAAAKVTEDLGSDLHSQATTGSTSKQHAKPAIAVQQPSSPPGVFGDLSDFPPLGPAKSPSSAIVDGKPPQIPVLLRQKGERASSPSCRKQSDTSSAIVVPSSTRRLT